MKQSKFMSMLETCLSTATGFGISLLAQWYFLPLIGVSISLHQNFVFAIIMTFVSLARGFVLRRLFEALHIRRPLSPAMLAVIAERFRQIEVEGWDTAHDDMHPPGELAQAGAAYAMALNSTTVRDKYSTDKARFILLNGSDIWPWTRDWWKADNPRRNYVKGAALILAELEKFDRNRKRR